MRVSLSTKELEKKILNIVDYSSGFLQGAQKGKVKFLNNLGQGTILVLKEYIDAEARSNPRALHHIYEWNKTGSPSARLYDINYTVSNIGLSFKSNFRQSTTISNGSSEPFYNKARVMEDGAPIRISPKKSKVLVFDVDGQTIFTSSSVVVNNPGGDQVQGSFEKAVDEFFNKYFRQSFLMSSGLYSYINKPVIYKKNFASGSKSGKSVGVSTGFKWIANTQMSGE
jgi:hypothetical protein